MSKISENSRTVLEFVKSVDGKAKVTAANIAEATGLGVRQVNGIVTSAFQRKGLMERKEEEITLEDGTHDKVKFVYLTDAGRAFDPDQTEAE